MSRHNIPPDIMAEADKCWSAMGFVNDRLDQKINIAISLFNERERCAQTAEHLNGWSGDNIAEHIAKVIRSGH